MKHLFILSLIFLFSKPENLLSNELDPSCCESPQGTYTLSIQELVPIKCNGGTGTLRALVTVTSGTVTGINYSWSGGGNTKDVVKPAGTYTVTVTSTNSGSKTASYTIVAPSPVLFVFNPYSGCNGSAGYIALKSIWGGTPPYNVQILKFSNNSIFDQIHNVPPFDSIGITLPPDQYKLRVFDMNLCSYSGGDIPFTISTTTKEFTNAGIVLTSPTCFSANNGIIKCTPEQITPGVTTKYNIYLYNASGNLHSFCPGCTSANFTFNIKAGNYTLEVWIPYSLCSKLVIPITITEPSQLVNNGAITDVDCLNNSTGKIINTTAGGNGGYKYAWSNNATTKDLINLKTGTFSLTTTDSKNCETNPKVQSFLVKEPTQLINTGFITHVDCFGAATGKIINTTSGGNTGMGYKYAWSNGAITKDILTIKAGTYSLTATDSKNCETNPKVQSYIVKEPLQLDPKGVITDVDCFGNGTGKIILNPVGGNGGFKYLWGNGATTKDLTGLKIGTYNVAVTDSKNCKTNPATINYTVNQPEKIVNTGFSTKDISCFGKSNGEIIQAVQGGVTPFTYLWNDGKKTADRNSLLKGTYNSTVTDFNNCTANFSYTIKEPTEFLQMTKSIIHESTAQKGSIDIEMTGGISPYAFDWTGPNGFMSISEDISGLSKGDYHLTVFDDNLCLIEKTFTIQFVTSTYNDVYSDLIFIQFDDHLQIKNLRENKDYELKLIRIDGSLVANSKIRTTDKTLKFDTKSFYPGCYLLQLFDDKQIITAKVILQ